MYVAPTEDVIVMFLDTCRSIAETPGQLTELLEAEPDFGPGDIFAALNLDISRRLQDDPSYDPREESKLFIPYLAKHGFVYDGGMKRFREANPSPTY